MLFRTSFIAQVIGISALALLAAHAHAETSATTPVTHAEFETLLRETLVQHPDILTDAIQSMQEKQKEKAEKEFKEGLTKYQNELFKDTSSPAVGPKNADVTFVQFFDYHCGYCKRLLPVITKLTEEDKKVRVIFREFPILSEDSVLASRAAIAVNRVAPDKYFAFHTELMKASGAYSMESLTATAKKLGVNEDKFRKAFESKETTAMLDKTRELAEGLGVRGTPAIAFPDQLLPGAVPYEKLKELVAAQRTGKKK